MHGTGTTSSEEAELTPEGEGGAWARLRRILDECPRSPDSVAGWLELLVTLVVIGLGAFSLIAAAAIAYGQPISTFWTKEFWLDELYTYFMVQGYPGKTTIEALANGGDYNPPALYETLKVWTSFFGLTEASFRAFSTLSVFTGLVCIYYMLGSRFSRLVCYVTTLGFWGTTGGLLVVYVFEARFYGPWFAGVAALCLLLVRPVDSKSGRWLRYLLMAMIGVWVCTVHYFGVISLALIGGGHVLFDLRSRQRWLDVTAFIPGVLALAIFLPMYQSQQALFANVPATWIDAPTVRSSIQFLQDWMLLWFFILPLGFYIVQTILRLSRPPKRAISFLKTFSAPMGLVLFPVIVVAMSWLLQPVMMPRYCIPYFIFWTPVVAYLLSRSLRVIKLLVLLLFLLMGARYNYVYLEQEDKRVDSVAKYYLQGIEPTTEMPIYTSTRLASYPLWYYGQLPANAVGIMFLPQGGDERMMLVESTNHLALVALGLDLPRLTTPRLLQQKEKFYFLIQGDELTKVIPYLRDFDCVAMEDPRRGDGITLYRFTRKLNAAK